MRNAALITFTAILVPGLALAQGGSTTQCTSGDMVRRIVILAEPGVSVPCEVHYFKDTEAPDQDQVLWRANNTAGYCEEQAAGLVSTLEQSGWDCGDGMPAAPAEPAMPATPAEPAEPADAAAPAEAPDEDMTDDLMPSEDPEG